MMNGFCQRCNEFRNVVMTAAIRAMPTPEGGKKLVEFIRKRTSNEEFDYQTLLHGLGRHSRPRDKISDLLRKHATPVGLFRYRMIPLAEFDIAKYLAAADAFLR
jgi:hypothetical protein